MVPIRFTVFATFLIFSSLNLYRQTFASPQEMVYLNDDQERCKPQCGDDQGQIEAFKNGKSVCLQYSDESEIHEPMIVTQCELDCMKQHAWVHKDQLWCFCEVCKGHEDLFCSAPGVGKLSKPEECLETVCKGKGDVKYFGYDRC